MALNCVANGKVLLKKVFDNIWIQPAAGDAGGSLGAALAYWYHELNQERIITDKKDSMRGSYLGPRLKNNEIESELNNLKANYSYLATYNEEQHLVPKSNQLKFCAIPLLFLEFHT